MNNISRIGRHISRVILGRKPDNRTPDNRAPDDRTPDVIVVSPDDAPSIPISKLENHGPENHGRQALPVDFNWQEYTTLYRDLGGFDRHQAENHYRDHGMAEGRFYSQAGMDRAIRGLEKKFAKLPEGFDWRDYISNYPDLKPISSAYDAARHFLEFGQKEGRLFFRFDPELYRSLYFEGARITESGLIEHYTTTGRERGLLATLEQIGQAEGLQHVDWLRYLKVEEFNLLNSRWSGSIKNKQDALRAMIREGFERLAPISFDAEFDDAYYAETNKNLATLSPPERYKHWLFNGIAEGVPGAPAARLKNLKLDIISFPEAFSWRHYAKLTNISADDRWNVLEHALRNEAMAPGSLPLQQQGAAEFLVAMAGAVVGSNPARAGAYFSIADHLKPLSSADRERWGDCLASQEDWTGALGHYRAAIEGGSIEVPVAVKAVQAALAVGEPRLAIDLLKQCRSASNGDMRWRNIVRQVLDAAFRDAWTEADAQYHDGQRQAGDRTMAGIAADIEKWWQEFDPIGFELPSDGSNRVVMLANVGLRQCTQYRVTQKIELARAAGINLEVYTEAEVDEFLNALPGASAAIFYRLPALPMNIRAMSACRALGVTSYYDIDDLIFDAKHYPEPIETYGATVSKSFYYSLQLGVPLFRAAQAMCDYGIASTTLLASYMEKVVRSGQCFVLPNGIDSNNIALFETRTPKVRRNDDIVLFYGSGTKAHNSDFVDLLGAPLQRLMEKYPNLRLMVVGFLSLGPEFDTLRERIVQVDWTADVESYWSLLAEADIAIAPLTSSATTDCKSEIKWLEAAALGVPAIVSGTHRYKEMLKTGHDVMIADTSQEWEQALEQLITSPKRRASLVTAARAKASSFYTIKKNAQRFKALLEPALNRAAKARKAYLGQAKKRILLFNIFFPPQTIGGSTRVARDNIDSFLKMPFAEECEFAVMTSDNDNPQAYDLRVENYRGIPVFRSNSPIDGIQEWRPFNERYGKLFERVLEMWRPDLVHVHSIQRGSASILTACIRQGVPYINTIHDGWWVSDYNFLTNTDGQPIEPEEPLPSSPVGHKSIGDSLERRRRLRPLLEGSAAILGVSDAFTELMQKAGYPQTRSVPNGAPHMQRVAKNRSTSGRVRLLQLSGETHHKGFHLVQGAIKQGRFKNIELTIIDHQRYGGPIKETIWGATPVRFVGKTRQEEIHQLYAAHDVLLAPSVWPESFGLVSREARDAGLWVIASDRGAIGESIEHGVNGWVIDVASIEPLLQALEEINAAPTRFVQSPPKTNSAIRTADDQARDLVSIYREILDGPQQQPARPYFMNDQFLEDPDASPEDMKWLAGERNLRFNHSAEIGATGRVPAKAR